MFGHIIDAYADRFVPSGPRRGSPAFAVFDGFGSFVQLRDDMHLFRETFLLFSLNLLDAILTIIWVRNGVATEGNNLMARLLDTGDFTFLTAKIAIGTITALVLLRWGHRRLARYGVALALAMYISLMGIHLVTGLTAFGYMSQNTVENIQIFADGLLAVIM